MRADEKYIPTREEVRERFIDGFPFDTWVLSRDRIGEDYDRYEAVRDAEQQRIGAVKALRQFARRFDDEGEALDVILGGVGEVAYKAMKQADRIEQEGKTDE